MARRRFTAGAGLAVTITTVLGWIGCDNLSRLADQTADLINRAPTLETVVRGAADAAAAAASPAAQPAAASPATAPLVQPAGYRQPADSRPFIVIGSFNIQVFGQSKLQDAAVMSYLVDIARQFDVLALQEIRSSDQTLLSQFVQQINADGRRYGFVLGPREGYTDSREQFAFVYNEQRVERVNDGFVARDPRGVIHRNPLGTTFRCRPVDARQPFSFTLLNVHTDPDVTASELESLAQIFLAVRQAMPQEDDLILLGDFNEPPERFAPLARIPNLRAAIPGSWMTNTRRTACYDNLVWDANATAEYAQQSGVFDLLQHYRLALEQGLRISDHLPVWAAFSIWEAGATTASHSALWQ